MAQPEVILDLCIIQLRNEPGCSGYVGRLDIERVESPSFRSFLYLIHKTMNEALRLEGVNASGGAPHPPFHFDYLDVNDGSKNAHAFQHAGFAFIVVTLPMVELVWHLSHRLSRSPLVEELLHLDSGAIDPDILQGLLFQIQLSFLVAHEYTHHIHQHCAESRSGAIGVWTEFRNDAGFRNIKSQAQELNADGYATYLVLTHLLREGLRAQALAGLSRIDMPGTDGDELLLMCFFLAIFASFCDIWRRENSTTSISQLTHPPPPVRIKYLIEVTKMWCGQNGSVSESWFSPARLQGLFRTANEIISEAAKPSWDAQMLFLQSADGVQYEQQLFEGFEAMRKNQNE